MVEGVQQGPVLVGTFFRRLFYNEIFILAAAIFIQFS